MPTDLQELLTGLTAEVPATSPPADLWWRGRRRHRVRQAGAGALTLLVVLLVAAGGLVVHQWRHGVTLSDSRGAPHLPSRVYTPSPWLGQFHGPPGQLIAVGTATHKTLFHSSTQVFGVTASDNRYGFLDLPGAFFSHLGGTPSLAISPDGRRVAYWITGTTTASSNTVLMGAAIVGVGVYDTTTGQVQTSTVSTPHGLAPDLLVWSDSTTLEFGFGQIVAGDDARGAHAEDRQIEMAESDVRVWVMGETAIEDGRIPNYGEVDFADASGHRLLIGGSGSVRWVEPGHTDRTVHVKDAPYEAGISPDGKWAVGIRGSGGNPNSLLIGRILYASRTTGRVVDLHHVSAESQVFRTLGWLDDRHVVVLHYDRAKTMHSSSGGWSRIDAVDVRTGASRVLVPDVLGGGNAWASYFVAGNLWGSPTRRATPPPYPLGIRTELTIGLGIAFVIAVWALLLGMTRARRA